MKKLVLLACSILLGYGANAQIAPDAGVNAFTTPFVAVQANTSQPVSVTVKNFGATALTSATLGFSVNGVVQPTFAWTGNLVANATSAAVTIGNFTFPAGNHTVKAWSKLPNGVADGNAANDTTTINIFTCTTLSGNYTINKNAAASATNFTSINAAAQSLANCGISGPVTLTVVPNSGPYNEQVILPVIPGTSSTKTVTFEGNGNTLTAATTTLQPGVIFFNGADYVKVNNLRILVDPTAPAGWGVQLINASDNNIITNCTVDVPLAASNNTFNGIIAGTSATANGNFANNLVVQNNIINAGYYGIVLSGNTTGTTTGNRVIGNKVRDSHYAGIYLNSAGTGSVIEGNDISRPTRVLTNSTFYGIYLAGATGTTTNTVVSKNRIHNTHDATSITNGSVNGIQVNTAATGGNENIIKNNLIYNINNQGGSINAFYSSVGSWTSYYHNTVSLDNPAISYNIVRGLNLLGAATNVKFINNILSLSSVATTKHALYLNSASVGLVSNNNNLFIGSTGKIGSFVNVDQATLADWKTANANAYDQNSVSVDPLFATPTYLQPLATALNNAGQPVATVTEDINGATRSTTTPDIGAYEFTPAVNDAGVTAIVAPTSPVTPGSQPVQVTLKNFGSATLTSATIGWSVNNVNQTPYSWTGSLNTFQATATPVNIGNYNFPTGNLVLKVWSQNPNSAADGLTANDTTILNIVSCAPLAGNYTINKNNPTAGTNFQSISEAAQKLNSCGVSAPVTITVAAGTGPYNEQIELGNIPYASATNTVTFEGSGNTVVGALVAKPGVFVLNGTKYVKLNNFVITVPATATTGWGVQLLNASEHNTISNNTIDLPLSSNASGLNGIIAAAENGVAGNNASYTKIQNNTINGGYYAIQMNGSINGLNAASNQITGNQIKDPVSFGIYINNGNGTLIEGNDISRPLRANGTTINGIYLNGTCLNTIISKNRIHNTHDVTPASSFYGIYILSPATPGNENIVKNNVIYNIKNTGSNFYGLYNSGGNGAYYYNNTVVSDPATNYSLLRGMHFATAATNVKFINNTISLECGPSTLAKDIHAIYAAFPGISLTSNNNNLYLGSAGNIGFYNANQATLTDWKAVNSNAYDQNSVSTSPIFVNVSTGNLKPTSSLMDNLGQPVAAVTDDILGAARNATTPDMGAYEFGIPANDVSIAAISGPAATACGLTATEAITVTIKNYGANTQTAVPVSYSVNGVAIAAPETFTGSIAPNATATYTFTATANMSVSGAYVITAKTLLAGDITTGNDADTAEFVNSVLAGLPVNLDFETTATGISRLAKTVNPNSGIKDGAAASNGVTSTKGLIMDGIDNTPSAWTIPVSQNDVWISNPNHFAGAYFCVSPAGGVATDSLIMTFDLKQLFKAVNSSTNFRVTVNGTQVGPTYRPPFSGTPINWQKIRVNLTAYKNDPTISIGLESSVKEAYANGTGTANLIDNIEIKHVAGPTAPTGVKDNALQSLVNVYPNPSTGLFNVSLPKGKTYELVVTDLSGKVLKKQTAKGGNSQLNLEGTAQGIYLLKVTGDNGSAVRKLIVE